MGLAGSASDLWLVHGNCALGRQSCRRRERMLTFNASTTEEHLGEEKTFCNYVLCQNKS